MKHYALLLALALPLTANAGWITNIASDATRDKGEDRHPTAEYNLDVFGNDVRVYEWTPADNPNIRCVFVAGNQNSTGVACYSAITSTANTKPGE